MEEWWKHKLFQPRNVEGEPTTEELGYVRELFKVASQEDSRLKGITIIGSTVKGYARPGNEHISDIDIVTVCDNSLRVDSQGWRTYDFLAEFEKSREKLNSIRVKKGLPIFKIDEVSYCDINYLTPERIKEINDLGTLWNVESLVFPSVGDLETYRRIIRNEINKYPKEEKEKWLQCVINYIVKRFNPKKLIEREIIKKDKEKVFLETRRKLIDARVRRIFG